MKGTRENDLAAELAEVRARLDGIEASVDRLSALMVQVIQGLIGDDKKKAMSVLLTMKGVLPDLKASIDSALNGRAWSRWS